MSDCEVFITKHQEPDLMIKYLFLQVRQTVSDFAVLIAVMLMIGVDAIFGIPTPKLPVPSSFQVKYSGLFIVSLSHRECWNSSGLAYWVLPHGEHRFQPHNFITSFFHKKKIQGRDLNFFLG